MNVHKNARLTPQGRALLVHRVRTDGWRVGDAALLLESPFDKRFVSWHGIGRAANLPSRTGVRPLPRVLGRPPDAVAPTPTL